MKTLRNALVATAILIASAASAQTVSVGSATATCGSTVDVPVSISSVSGLLALQFDVSFNTSALTFQKEHTSKGSLTGNFSIDSASSGGTLRVVMAAGTAVSGSGTVAVLKFAVASNANGTQALTISNVLVNDVERSGTNGEVRVSCSGGTNPPPPTGGGAVSVGSVSAMCSSSADVPVSITDAANLRALEFDVAYPGSSMTLQSVIAGTLNSSFSVEKHDSNGTVRVVMAGGSGVSGSGTVAVLKFTLSSSATGSLPLTISNVKVNDVAATGTSGAIAATCSSGAPSAPANVAPVNESTNVAIPVTLRWTGSTGASTYRVKLGTSNPPQFHNATDRTTLGVTTQPGTTYYWQVEAVNNAGATAGPVWQFITAGTNCATPTAPQLFGPGADVVSGSRFAVTWSSAQNATEYVLEEAGDASFTNASTSIHTGASATFTLWYSNPTTRYFRLRARNASPGCSVDGPRSASVSVRIVPGNVSDGTPRFLAVAGSVPGSGGSYFRTSMQLHNHTDAMMRGRLVFHRSGSSGSSSDPSFTYDLAPGVTRSYSDVVLFFGTGGGIGSIDVISTDGEAPLCLARIYNDGGSSGTTGAAVDAMTSDQALKAGQRGQLLAPIDPLRARMNIGVRTLQDGATIDFTLRDYTGTVRGFARRTYASTWFEQFGTGALFEQPLRGDEVVVIEVMSGSAIVYGSITDNLTQDPTIQFARAR